MEIKKVYINEDKYPVLLKEIAEPPNPLYYIGNLGLLNKECIAVVGSRRTTQYGRWTARTLGKKIAAAGGVVVSGMAAGIDACAHWGAVDAGEGSGTVNTVAVMGCGIDQCYPKGNRELWDKIVSGGLIVSEYAPGTEATKYTFPRRNRIISGLSGAVVVVQAPNSSGALITAERAVEQGREVYAVPANINSEYNFGSNKLLLDGANPLVIMDDLLADRGLFNGIPEEADLVLGDEEKKVLAEILVNGERTSDQLAAALEITAAEINGIVTIMEMKGILCTSLGKIFIAK